MVSCVDFFAPSLQSLLRSPSKGGISEGCFNLSNGRHVTIWGITINIKLVRGIKKQKRLVVYNMLKKNLMFGNKNKIWAPKAAVAIYELFLAHLKLQH